MRQIFDYINNNSFLATIIGIILGWFLNNISNKRERNIRRKEEFDREKRKQYENKAEFLIDNNMEDNGLIPVIKIFLSDFDVEYTKDKKNFNFKYSEDILDSKKYKCKVFYLKNIGNADINQLDICVVSQKNNMLVDYDGLESIVKDEWINYNYCYDKKILKNEAIRIDLYYLENSRIRSIFSSELVILFKDSYNNLYEQPFFIANNNLYEPSKITYKEYRENVTVDTAIECFKNPWMW